MPTQAFHYIPVGYQKAILMVNRKATNVLHGLKNRESVDKEGIISCMEQTLLFLPPLLHRNKDIVFSH